MKLFILVLVMTGCTVDYKCKTLKDEEHCERVEGRRDHCTRETHKSCEWDR